MVSRWFDWGGNGEPVVGASAIILPGRGGSCDCCGGTEHSEAIGGVYPSRFPGDDFEGKGFEAVILGRAIFAGRTGDWWTVRVEVEGAFARVSGLASR